MSDPLHASTVCCHLSRYGSSASRTLSAAEDLCRCGCLLRFPRNSTQRHGRPSGSEHRQLLPHFRRTGGSGASPLDLSFSHPAIPAPLPSLTVCQLSYSLADWLSSRGQAVAAVPSTTRINFRFDKAAFALKFWPYRVPYPVPFRLLVLDTKP